MTNSNVFNNKNFIILWLGAFICMVGDQLSLIALPWLVLKLTNSPFDVAGVLSIMGIPRAVFILIGGVFTDKFKPKNVLLYARLFSCIALLSLAFLLWVNAINIYIIYGFALMLGLASAFTLPAGMTILPTLLPVNQLKAGSGIMMSSMQLSAVVGPILAGFLISIFSKGATTAYAFSDAAGIALAFALDGATFFISVLSLSLLKFSSVSQDLISPQKKTSLINAISNGFTYLKSDNSLFMYILYIAVVSFFIVGPAAVGIPILVETKFSGNAWDYGLFLTVQGAGMVVGMVFSIVLPNLPQERLGVSILILDCLAGMCVLLFAVSTSLSASLSLLFLIGIIGGFIQVIAYTWIQIRASHEYLGRVMSYLMFASMGLAPVSAILSGFIIAKTSVTIMFALVGVMITVMALIALLSPAIRNMGLAPNEAN